jgi:hypothetical protein
LNHETEDATADRHSRTIGIDHELFAGQAVVAFGTADLEGAGSIDGYEERTLFGTPVRFDFEPAWLYIRKKRRIMATHRRVESKELPDFTSRVALNARSRFRLVFETTSFLLVDAFKLAFPTKHAGTVPGSDQGKFLI